MLFERTKRAKGGCICPSLASLSLCILLVRPAQERKLTMKRIIDANTRPEVPARRAIVHELLSCYRLAVSALLLLPLVLLLLLLLLSPPMG
jgi:hypothetical protein